MIEKFSDRKTMALGSCLCITFVIAFIAPSSKTGPTDTSIFVSPVFLYPLMLITAFLDGSG
jgi:hypothetical protein